MNARIITADARKMSGAEFVALHMPRPSELDRLVGEIWQAAWNNDREKVAALHRDLKALNISSPYDLEAKRNPDGSYSVAA